MISKPFIKAAALGALIVTAPLAIETAEAAMPVPPRPSAQDGIMPVWGGCGPYGHRGPWGGCRPGGQWNYRPYYGPRPYYAPHPYYYGPRPYYGPHYWGPRRFY
jgi:hypothetical protein